jgi:hypothetical protein
LAASSPTHEPRTSDATPVLVHTTTGIHFSLTRSSGELAAAIEVTKSLDLELNKVGLEGLHFRSTARQKKIIKLSNL